MSDAVYQHQPLISQTLGQQNNSIKKDKPIITQIVRQPSIPQIRISKNNRSSNYQPTPNKLNNEKQIQLQLLQKDYTSIESTILFSSQICLNEFTVQSQSIMPTIAIKHSTIIIQEDQKVQQQLQNFNESITKHAESKINEQIQDDVQTITICPLKEDKDQNINTIDFRTKSLMFGDLAVLNLYRKRADCNKINHSLQIVSKLNKFKSDKQSSTQSKIPSIGILPLNIQLQQQFISVLPSNPTKLIQIQQENYDEQIPNKLNFTINLLNLQNDAKYIQDEPINLKQTQFRPPLKQESKKNMQQSLSFNTNTIFDEKECFIQSFPSRSLKLTSIKFDAISKESNCIQINQLIIQNDEKIYLQSIQMNEKFKLQPFQQDKTEYSQTQIMLSMKIIQETNTIVQPSKNTINPLPNLGKCRLIRDFFKEVSRELKFSFNQLNIHNETDLLLNQIPQNPQNQFNLKILQTDNNSQINRNMIEMTPNNFENDVEVQFIDQVQTKDKPQYPTLLEMNRMKIERIKQIITGAKSPKDLIKPNLEIKEEVGLFVNKQKQFGMSDGSPKFNYKSVNGSKVFDDPNKKDQIKLEKLRSSSIDKATMHMQMSKNQSSVLNRFKKIKYLGRGKMSDVYSVIDKKTGMALALKIIQKSLIKSKGLANLVSNEIKIQMCMVHSNILKCFGVLDDNKQIALILELSDQTLYNLIRVQKLSRIQTLNILFQILNAVNYLHSCGIIHRDVKPENILLCQDVIKLADLGISIKAYHSAQYCGTIGYMAPEIIQYQNYTSKVDCYSIGILIFEMIYQKLPNQLLCQIQNLEKDPLIDLMNNLIEHDQDIRFSCQQALNHEVFKDLKQNQQAKPLLQKEIIRLL